MTQTDDARRFAPATLRNRQPILAVLREVLPDTGTVLEIASGSGEHAVYFAEALPGLHWQPSDADAGARASIVAWTESLGLQNVCCPLDLDASAPDWPVAEADAVVCINMIHISPWASAEGLFAGAARLLSPGAPLVLYGPFKRGGAHTAPSNEEFDAALRAQDPRWGVRDLEVVGDLAAASGFVLDRVVEMPANNLTVVFRKAA
ncbi:DUF938 domain-containing protein [Aerophototrophica crusticola]|uniref:DUF938 domain-containing protein n=1 Tax=Aerophototrophica crusticola TaxID=1709002 RepID=A0A858R3S2_9PROT|nr:DUF938 domain-containing protein [Rhodospirillaceae bacterium B3]